MLRRLPRRSIAGESTQEHLVDGAKEAFDFAAPPRHPRLGEHERHVEIGADLHQMVGGEVAAVIAIENGGYPCYLPMWKRFTPNRLAQGQGGLNGGRGLDTEPETGNGPTVIVHNHCQPGPHEGLTP